MFAARSSRARRLRDLSIRAQRQRRWIWRSKGSVGASATPLCRSARARRAADVSDTLTCDDREGISPAALHATQSRFRYSNSAAAARFGGRSRGSLRERGTREPRRPPSPCATSLREVLGLTDTGGRRVRWTPRVGAKFEEKARLLMLKGYPRLRLAVQFGSCALQRADIAIGKLMRGLDFDDLLGIDRRAGSLVVLLLGPRLSPGRPERQGGHGRLGLRCRG